MLRRIMGVAATTFSRMSLKGTHELKPSEETIDNGFVFSHEYYIPEEVLALIFSYLSDKELVFVCRRVCKTWCNVIDTRVWKMKLANSNVPPSKIQGLSWKSCYWLHLKSPLNKNLLRNNCGQEELKHWKLHSNGGDGWVIERPPVGCEAFPEEYFSNLHKTENSCFATSFYSCSKSQMIDLIQLGATSEFMDKFQPHIIVTEWYTGRFDCKSVYELKIKLLNSEKEMVDHFSIRKNVGGTRELSTWNKATHVFRDYGKGVAYIEFYHGGMDSQFWRGHYGSKMTGGSIFLSIP